MNSNVGCSFDLQVFSCQLNFTFQVRLFSFSLYCLTRLGWRRARRLYSSTQEAWNDGVLLISRCSLSRYSFLLFLVLSYTAGLAPCKKASFFYTGSMERRVSFDLQVFTFQVRLSPSPCTVLHGWAGAVQEGFILQHRKHWKMCVVLWSADRILKSVWKLLICTYCTYC